MRFHLLTVWIALLVNVCLGDSPSEAKRINDRSCRTNAECLQRGLPLLPARRGTPTRRQFAAGSSNQPPVPYTFTGTTRTVSAPPGTYRIFVRGASGGSATDGGIRGGFGAELQGLYTVGSDKAYSFQIYVGQAAGSTSTQGAGGGGYSAVRLLSGTGSNTVSDPLVYAGGGGGAGPSSGSDGIGGDASTSEVATPGKGTNGGQAGTSAAASQGGTDAGGGNGGGGTSAATGTGGGNGASAQSGQGGGNRSTGDGFGGEAGGAGYVNNGRGGYDGGGGGGSFGGGGGGGWYGGGGGDGGPNAAGGGGSSFFYDSSAIERRVVSTVAGDGLVTIQKIG